MQRKIHVLVTPTPRGASTVNLQCEWGSLLLGGHWRTTKVGGARILIMGRRGKGGMSTKPLTETVGTPVPLRHLHNGRLQRSLSDSHQWSVLLLLTSRIGTRMSCRPFHMLPTLFVLPLQIHTCLCF